MLRLNCLLCEQNSGKVVDSAKIYHKKAEVTWPSSSTRKGVAAHQQVDLPEDSVKCRGLIAGQFGP